jgi:hypothetical protein
MNSVDDVSSVDDGVSEESCDRDQEILKDWEYSQGLLRRFLVFVEYFLKYLYRTSPDIS